MQGVLAGCKECLCVFGCVCFQSICCQIHEELFLISLVLSFCMCLLKLSSVGHHISN